MWIPAVNCPSQETEETSTHYKICWEFRVNDERPTWKKNIVIKWNDGGKIGNRNTLILTEILPSVTWNMIIKSNDFVSFKMHMLLSEGEISVL